MNSLPACTRVLTFKSAAGFCVCVKTWFFTLVWLPQVWWMVLTVTESQCHMKGSFYTPWRALQTPSIHLGAALTARKWHSHSWAAWHIYLRGAEFWWISGAWWVCGDAGSTFPSLPACEWVLSAVWVTPHVDQSAGLCCDTSASLLQHPPGQFFLLFPLHPHALLLLSHCPGGRTLQSRAPSILGINRDLGLFWSLPFYSPSLPFYSSRHTELLSSPCACSQLLNSPFPGSGWAGIFHHPALFWIHALFHHILLLLDLCGTCRNKLLELGVRNSALEHSIPCCWKGLLLHLHKKITNPCIFFYLVFFFFFFKQDFSYLKKVLSLKSCLLSALASVVRIWHSFQLFSVKTLSNFFTSAID